MTNKSKRKVVPRRPIWQIVVPIIVIATFAVIGWRLYSAFSAADDGADIIFIRADGNGINNIYTLDIGSTMERVSCIK